MNFLRFGSVLFLLSGCFRFSGKIIREERLYSSGPDLVVHSLRLKTDSTFIYRIYGDMMNARSEGKWELRKGKLYLNSYQQYRNGFGLCKRWESQKGSVDSLYLRVSDDKGDALPFATVYYAGSGRTADEEGLVTFRKQQTGIIRVSFVGTEFSFPISDSLSNSVDVILYLKDNSKIYFDRAQWQFRGKKLTSPEGIELHKMK
jgi:hypothetical protein